MLRHRIELDADCSLDILRRHCCCDLCTGDRPPVAAKDLAELTVKKIACPFVGHQIKIFRLGQISHLDGIFAVLDATDALEPKTLIDDDADEAFKNLVMMKQLVAGGDPDARRRSVLLSVVAASIFQWALVVFVG